MPGNIENLNLAIPDRLSLRPLMHRLRLYVDSRALVTVFDRQFKPPNLFALIRQSVQPVPRRSRRFVPLPPLGPGCIVPFHAMECGRPRRSIARRATILEGFRAAGRFHPVAPGDGHFPTGWEADVNGSVSVSICHRGLSPDVGRSRPNPSPAARRDCTGRPPLLAQGGLFRLRPGHGRT
jgi:hypothetical protein